MALTNDLTEVGKRLARVPLLFAPGTQRSYGIAVDVQALSVQTISGQKFANYVRSNVFAPIACGTLHAADVRLTMAGMSARTICVHTSRPRTPGVVNNANRQTSQGFPPLMVSNAHLH